ncbi:SDR family NAD(P)-dependent oxidoreductase [Stenotrophobium rhamnosiphilum]|uniref:MaoC-like domain-containing protein n=1 Tax=Stenotrophobium rhamnosiphilum TaxID=2029166 RepID=A0A2T5MII6_9GAMM|nr:SDR family NAD(P)-dependent oxidoreductase [Stenotrophobium rhamnosiphilum]PTU32359.1 hypothetical protein CJD38_06840 [Stenotrophobium rhamnosiphilum]
MKNNHPLSFSIDSFKVGDYVSFERVFTCEDAEFFRTLSGDENPLHYDQDYARDTEFGKTIAPLQLTLLPLSMIAGMIFPGEPSLILGQEVRAPHPIFFGEAICYSARIEAINASHRILTIRILALRGNQVLIDSRLRVQARVAEWHTPSALAIQRSTTGRSVVITGGSGEIGRAIAWSLAKEGWQIFIHDRGVSANRDQLIADLSRINAQVRFIDADLTNAKGREKLATELSKIPALDLVVHAASPGVTASVEDLISVNFSALKEIISAVTPVFLSRQSGTVAFIGSKSIEVSLPGWEAYSGAKSMAVNLINGMDRSFSNYGVRGLNILPDMVLTEFSKDFRGDQAMLLPQEVAVALLDVLRDREVSENTVIIEPGKIVRGRVGFHATAAAVMAVKVSSGNVGASVKAEQKELQGSIDSIVREILRLPADYDVGNAALGVTPGWDSLKHLELLLAIESSLKIHFASSEMALLKRFSDLDALCRSKINAGKANE